MNRLLCLCLTLISLHAIAQETIIFGAGSNSNVDVYSSSDFIRSDWDQAAIASNTINGSGMDAKLLEASRFLGQATLGADERLIREVAELGFEAWIDQQSKLPATL